ncbi:type II toxin-antitoxin system PemK/MazF family toxin [soil metagenome]
MGVVKPVARAPSRGDVFLVQLDPTRGSEIRKTRPCLIVSPDELNHHLRTTIVAPLTTGGHSYPYRVPCRVQGKSGHIVLDQLRTVDHERLRKRLGTVNPRTLQAVLRVLAELFEI